jgi:predicted Co/Zn/Cd cation transporter (cation efflux family)
MALYEHRANRRTRSDFVWIDVQGWIMAGGFTTALLIAFAIGYAVAGTEHAWITPYNDPSVLLVVCLVLLPMPIGTLRRAASEVLLITPDDLLGEVDRVAGLVVADAARDYPRRDARDRGIGARSPRRRGRRTRGRPGHRGSGSRD